VVVPVGGISVRRHAVAKLDECRLWLEKTVFVA